MHKNLSTLNSPAFAEASADRQLSALNIVFFGTPDFATPSLETLISAGLKPVCVVTRQDKPGKRGKELIKSPIKILAEKNNIPVLQPEKLDNAFHNKLCAISPELMIVVAYGKILPKKVLDIPKFGTLNVHGSLLPKYRGASPIQEAILNGENKTGVTIMKMDEGMDTGDIISTQETKYDLKKITADKLLEELSNIGANLLIKTLPAYVNGELKLKKQKENQATYSKIIKKEDGKINWNESAELIERKSRAYYSWPGTYTYLKLKTGNPKLLKIIPPVSCQLSAVNCLPGTVFLTEKKELAITCKNSYIIPSTLQLEGKQPMSARDFLNGYSKIIDAVFN